MASLDRTLDYDFLPSADAARAMRSWVECPVHGSKVGVAADGTILGRCGECMNEVARALAVIVNGATLARTEV